MRFGFNPRRGRGLATALRASDGGRGFRAGGFRARSRSRSRSRVPSERADRARSWSRSWSKSVAVTTPRVQSGRPAGPGPACRRRHRAAAAAVHQRPRPARQRRGSKRFVGRPARPGAQSPDSDAWVCPAAGCDRRLAGPASSALPAGGRRWMRPSGHELGARLLGLRPPSQAPARLVWRAIHIASCSVHRCVHAGLP